MILNLFRQKNKIEIDKKTGTQSIFFYLPFVLFQIDVNDPH